MSVIFGIKEGNTVTICGDKRFSTDNGELISDDAQKVRIINEKLAFASAGNASIEEAIMIDSRKLQTNELTTEALLQVIIEFYKRVDDNGLTLIGNFPYCALIAGASKSGAISLISVSRIHGKLTYQEAPMALFPPFDVEMQKCAEIFVRNYKLMHKRYCEQTIQDIAGLSKVVSPTGSKWVYNTRDGIGTFMEF